MMHLFLMAPTLHVGGFYFNVNNHPQEEPDFQLEGALAGDVVVAAASSMDLRFFAELDGEVLRYTGLGADINASAWRLAAELGPFWRFGRAPLVGTAEFGFGLHPYLAAPGYASMVSGVGTGTHTMIGVELGSGPVRVTFGLRGAFTLAIAPGANATLGFPEGTASWSWSPMSVRASVVVGLAFDGPKPGTNP